VLGGLLLVLPGFLTDLAGIALLIAPVREWFGRIFRTRFEAGSAPAERAEIARILQWSTSRLANGNRCRNASCRIGPAAAIA